MPIYEYRCLNCGRVFEKFVFKNEEKKVKCTYCNSEKTEKILSGFRLGRSFYSGSSCGSLSGRGSGFS